VTSHERCRSEGEQTPPEYNLIPPVVARFSVVVIRPLSFVTSFPKEFGTFVISPEVLGGPLSSILEVLSTPISSTGNRYNKAEEQHP
jgi:hypothetical protein